MEFLVTVIIPVYNGEKFIERSLDSVLYHSEVTEVLVINDGSTDGTEHILDHYSSCNSRVEILCHAQKINKGRSASRNLGLQRASGPYIAFLDADDFFLPNRFIFDKEIFFANKEADGVYNAIGVHFYRDFVEEEEEALNCYMVTEELPSDSLFKELLIGRKGHFSIDGLTLKKSVLENVGYFNECLPVAEDTEFMWRIALNHSLVTGSLKEIVAKRGVHESNIFDNESAYKDRLLEVCEELLLWVGKNNAHKEKIDILLKTLWNYRYRHTTTISQHIKHWGKQFLTSYKLLFTMHSIKYFPLVRRRKELFSFLYKR
ncbi:glycosyltransferase family A protein [uncultured Dokdonia sp.]|uniref:glycosyltransferase family 2 protein n=1 Tax=uncultured Dokdonia sp. TaxID=575653 RepID=UPI0030EE2AAF|tara:strand:+ start:51729 stop:52679 length:951 start_codon:yes stop_codon:yes gene_type:complete